MSLYELPRLNLIEKAKKMVAAANKKRNGNFKVLAAAISISIICGFFAGAVSGGIFYFNYISSANSISAQGSISYQPQTQEEDLVIKTVKDSSPAVVNIVVTKNLPVYEQYFEHTPFGPSLKQQQKGTQKQEVGQGSGFIISEDGTILTNRHVVLDDQADYTVFTNAGKKYSAKVLARDSVLDLAVLKIEGAIEKFPILKLGNSDSLDIGQTVIAIGNALGEFKNTVSVGVISGLGRRITASDPSGGGFSEVLDNVIQTDAAINSGNSGGPLLNLKGEVIGINSAVVTEAQSIGFSIPINQAKKAIDQVSKTGKIVYPFIGVRYVLVNDDVKTEKNLPVDYGALVLSGSSGGSAVEPGSAAEKAGIKEGDIILEFGGEKITMDNSLSNLVMKYNPGDQVKVKVLRIGQEQEMTVTLGERK